MTETPCLSERSGLSRWNAQWSTDRSGLIAALLVFLGASAFFIGHTHYAHSLTAPPEPGGDSPLYDSLGWEWSTGRGHQVDFDNPEFLSPYLDAGTADRVEGAGGVNVDRPPLYPWLLAIGNRWFGRQFWFARVVQALLMGSVAAIAAHIAFQTAGLAPALLTGFLFTIVDWRTRWSVRELLTESLACWLVTLFAVCLLYWLRTSRLRWITAAGLVWGIAILCRTMMVLWLPVLIVSLLLVPRRAALRCKLCGLALLLMTGLLVCLPWWWRTCALLGEFRPLGTQGAEQLSAAYSDRAFSRLGMWFNLDAEGFFNDLTEPPGSVALVRARAERSSQQARDWILAHPLQAILLWPLRLLQEYRPHGPGELFILGFALLGMGLLRDRSEGQVGWTVLAAQSLAIAATWSVAGRFVIPLLGLLHAVAGIGLWTSYVMLVERRRSTAAAVLLAE